MRQFFVSATRGVRVTVRAGQIPNGFGVTITCPVAEDLDSTKGYEGTEDLFAFWANEAGEAWVRHRNASNGKQIHGQSENRHDDEASEKSMDYPFKHSRSR